MYDGVLLTRTVLYWSALSLFSFILISKNPTLNHFINILSCSTSSLVLWATQARRPSILWFQGPRLALGSPAASGRPFPPQWTFQGFQRRNHHQLLTIPLPPTSVSPLTDPSTPNSWDSGLPYWGQAPKEGEEWRRSRKERMPRNRPPRGLGTSMSVDPGVSQTTSVWRPLSSRLTSDPPTEGLFSWGLPKCCLPYLGSAQGKLELETGRWDDGWVGEERGRGE